MSDEKREAKVKNTALARCSCENEYQDQRYGKGVRVWNRGGSKERPKFTCTVCAAKR